MKVKSPPAKLTTPKHTRVRAIDPHVVEIKKLLSVTNFSGMYRLDPIERIEIVKKGVPAVEVAKLAKSMGRPKKHIFELLGLPRATVDRQARTKQQLSIDQGERVIGFSKLVGQVQVMVEEFGDSKNFDAAKWVTDWLDRPAPALNGRRPGEYMDTAEGQEIVSGLIAKIQSGAYA